MQPKDIAGIDPVAQATERYWPQLDGIRGIAILLVLGVHTEGRFVGGILGVDLFFVLSGFLISTLLLTERLETGNINAAHFYARRALRLLPALTVAIALIVVLGRLPGARPTDLAIGIPVVLLYAMNWVIVYTHRPLGNFGPFWSLAIEEQFYLVWPWAIRKWGDVRRLPEILVAIAVVIMVTRTGWALEHWRGSNDFTFFRADGLLLGAALAVVLVRREHVELLRILSARWVAPVALAGFAVPIAVLVVRTNNPIGSVAYGCANVAGVALIGSVVLVPGSLVGRVLRTRPLVALGRVSYGIYVFNFTIFTLVYAQHWTTPITLAVDYSAIAAITLTSWFLIEQPALRFRRRFR